ncbi:unnamed protein product [Didymodactylos carnosus]|uniref:J domain-containing protein n=1 Tax=Didymodactylos carnosus TaxID=1234261 RepID=A0A8S2CPP6_9BILA|nr:unnamed protein product [Didymodactylos carnosus]CAF3513624.1 unnamed protein product [Didymodactylos carnosus]
MHDLQGSNWQHYPFFAKELVISKLSTIISDPSDLALALSFLAAQGSDSVYMNTLCALLKEDERFQSMTKQFLTDIHTSTEDPEFKKIMTTIWDSYSKGDPQATKAVGNSNPIFDINLHNYLNSKVAVINLQQALRLIPLNQRGAVISKILKLAEHIAGQRALTSKALSSLSQGGTSSRAVTPVAIVVVLLSWEALKSISSWWKGEISGRRCVKQLIDALSALAGGYAGGAAGAIAGTAVFPGVGSLVGGVVGGLLGSSGAAALSKWLTEYFFDLPPTAALEKAYKFLDLKPSCTNSEINSAFRSMALKYHPDKEGGSAEDFHKLQVAVAIIKQARGEGI